MAAWAFALGGGVLIGASAGAFLWSQGRVAGISSLVEDATTSVEPARGTALAFLIGLAIAGLVAALVAPGHVSVWPSASLALTVLAGLLVGFGTRLGRGCTSGHGVCGIGRFSKRSIVATCVFMGTGAAATFFVRHVVGTP